MLGIKWVLFRFLTELGHGTVLGNFASRNTAFFLFTHWSPLGNRRLSIPGTAFLYRLHCLRVPNFIEVLRREEIGWFQDYFFWLRLSSWLEITSDSFHAFLVVLGDLDRGNLVVGKVVSVVFHWWIFFGLLNLFVLSQQLIVHFHEIQCLARTSNLLLILLNQAGRSFELLSHFWLCLVFILF